MECVLIRSKLIASAAYYEKAEILCVWFHSGKSAWHENVSQNVFKNFANADSPGFYYSNYIKDRSLSKRPERWSMRRLMVQFVLAAIILSASDLGHPWASRDVAAATGNNNQANWYR